MPDLPTVMRITSRLDPVLADMPFNEKPKPKVRPMIIDELTILRPKDILDRGMSRPGERLHVLLFSHLEQAEDIRRKFTRVRKGRLPSKRYVRAVYRTVMV